MSYIPQTPYEPAPNRVVPPRPIRLLEKAAVALTAVADAAWSAARYPHYKVMPISLATAPAVPRPQPHWRAPKGLDPEHPLMGPHPTDREQG